MSIKNYWQLFTMTENERLGESQVGSCHFMPNSKPGYVYDMEDVVPSSHRLWYNYPIGFPMNLSDESRFDMVSVDDWRGRPDYVWQFEHIPRAQGIFDGRWANWWKYIVDVNEETGRDSMCTLPWAGTPKSLVPTVITHYGGLTDRVVLRWERHLGDPNNCIYMLYTDNVLQGSLQRRGEMHIKLSKDVNPGSSYTIALPGVWTAKYDEPSVVVPPIIGGTLTIEQAKAILESMHAAGTPLALCPKPQTYTEDTNNVYAVWLVGGGTTLTVQKKWTEAQIRQFYGMIYPKQLCGTVVIEPPPPVIIPPGKLTVSQVTQMVDILHTLPDLANCPKPSYTEDQGNIFLHWSGQPTMQIDRDWTVSAVNNYYTAMYPKSACASIITPPPPIPSTDVEEWVRENINRLTDELDMWERLLDQIA